ncbi:MAG: low molecular weight phosphatase family protein [Alphaproteobacteria bacterium]
MNEPDKLPSAVLFVCFLNSIRSPMAEGLMKARFGKHTYVQSCGMSAGELDDLMVAVMAEKGIDMSQHNSRTLHDLDDASFDVVIAFTEAAGEAAKAYFEDTDAVVEVWPTPDPTAGSLDVRSMMNNYRSVRDYIEGRITRRFPSK